MRSLVLLSLSACTIRGLEGPVTTDASPEADASVATVDAAKVTPPDAPGFQCRDKVTLVGDGHHHAGENCQNGCHNHGFKLSGTLYTTATSTTPVIGATITIKDGAGFTYEMVSNENGNFYTSSSMTFPVTVIASMCPDVHAMTGTISAANGGCNKAGCHVAGAQGRVHLP